MSSNLNVSNILVFSLRFGHNANCGTEPLGVLDLTSEQTGAFSCIQWAFFGEIPEMINKP
jgi:hypothetical protein